LVAAPGISCRWLDFPSPPLTQGPAERFRPSDFYLGLLGLVDGDPDLVGLQLQGGERKVRFDAPLILFAPDRYRDQRHLERDLARAAAWRGLVLVFTSRPKAFARALKQSRSGYGVYDALQLNEALSPAMWATREFLGGWGTVRNAWWTEGDWLPYAEALAAHGGEDYRVTLVVPENSPAPPGVPAFRVYDADEAGNIGEFVDDDSASLWLARILGRLRVRAVVRYNAFSSWEHRNYATLLRHVEELMRRGRKE
jgi:hypothetical protein